MYTASLESTAKSGRNFSVAACAPCMYFFTRGLMKSFRCCALFIGFIVGSRSLRPSAVLTIASASSGPMSKNTAPAFSTVR